MKADNCNLLIRMFYVLQQVSSCKKTFYCLSELKSTVAEFRLFHALITRMQKYFLVTTNIRGTNSL